MSDNAALPKRVTKFVAYTPGGDFIDSFCIPIDTELKTELYSDGSQVKVIKVEKDDKGADLALVLKRWVNAVVLQDTYEFDEKDRMYYPILEDFPLDAHTPAPAPAVYGDHGQMRLIGDMDTDIPLGPPTQQFFPAFPQPLPQRFGPQKLNEIGDPPPDNIIRCGTEREIDGTYKPTNPTGDNQS